MEETEATVVVLDDDPLIHKIIEKAIGKTALHCVSTADLLEQFATLNPLAIFVDIHLGTQESGLDILPKLRDKWPFCPIIVITGDRDDDAIGNALAGGANDFIYKPIHPKELIARMQARLDELAKREAKEVMTIGDIVVDTAHRILTNRNRTEQRYLSPTEMSLLTCLLNAKGTVVRREIMKRKCWGQIYVSDNALNRKLHEVRRALKEVSSIVNIKTLYGTGFTLEVTTSDNKNHSKKSA